MFGNQLILGGLFMKFENRPSSLIVGLTPASDKEMNVFGKICQIAEHGASYDENWKALGYDVPKNGFFSGSSCHGLS